MDAIPLDLLLIAAGAFAGAIVAGLAGFAFAATSIGVWAHFFPPSTIAPLAVIGSLLVQLTTVALIRKHVDWRTAGVFVIGGLLGVPLGILLLAHFPPDLFRLLIGGVLVVYCGGLLLSGHMPAMTSPGRWADGGIGFCGGVLGGFTGLSGILPTLWCTLQKWSKDRQRSTYQVFNLTMHIATATGYFASGKLGPELPRLLFAALPSLALGSALGYMLYKRVNDAQFRKIVLWLLLISGATLLVPR